MFLFGQAPYLLPSYGPTPQNLPGSSSPQDNERFLGKLKAQSQAHPGLKLDLNLNLHQMTQEFSPQ